MPHAINKDCTKCGACVLECPTGSIVEGLKQYYIDTDTCSDHAACVAVCPVDAIHPQVIEKDKSEKSAEEEA
jgi:ferredoxin